MAGSSGIICMAINLKLLAFWIKDSVQHYIYYYVIMVIKVYWNALLTEICDENDDEEEENKTISQTGDINEG
ncbi:3566_t:CDS:2 [Rhizophagus irregularis]|nr:3566_t:CDS:2 [Rhizophagus irregularis]